MSVKAFSLFSKPIREEVSKLGWRRPTSIQGLAIPLILRGKNVLLIAPTGTGKTEAAIFPVFEKFIQERNRKKTIGISILYITPLRALNRDILRRIVEIGEHLDIKVQVRHGDTPQKARRMQALKPPDMLITTPETLQAILPGKKMRIHLRSVQCIIVDEIHEIANDKRGVQLSFGLERLRELTDSDFQRIFLSATIGSPDQISNLLVGTDGRAIVLKTEEEKDFEVSIESPTAKSEDKRTAKDIMISPSSVRRIQRLFELIGKYRSALIFTNTREHAEALASRMRALKPNVIIGIHHGSLSQSVRVETERRLKEGEFTAVICTSSLELGIDIGFVEFVVQYMSPRQVTRLVQRVGRSGHAIGGFSRGLIMAAWSDDILESAVISKFAKDGKLETPNIHKQALDVLAHQIVGLTLDWDKIRADYAYRITKRAWPYRDLKMTDFVAVIKQLENGGKVWFDGQYIRKRHPRIFDYYYTNLSTIPDVKRYYVLDFISGKRIGTLDQEFIAKNGDPGQEFIMHGQTWKILGVDEEKGNVRVELVYHSMGAIPSWQGEIIPVPFEVAQEVGKLRKEIAKKLLENQNAIDVLKNYPINEEASRKAINTIEKQIDERYPVPTDRTVVIECFESYAIIHSCFGNLVNETLAKILASLLSSRLGVNVATHSDPYRIALITPTFLEPTLLQDELLKLRPEEVDLILKTTLQGTSLFAWRLWNVAKRFGIVERYAEYRSSRARILVTALQDTPVSWETLREIYTEKMDINHSKTVLGMIRDGEIKVVSIHRPKEYSPLALPVLDKIAPQDLLRPIIPTKAVIDIVKERLYSEEIRLVCIINADYDCIRKLRNLPEVIRCPKCRSTLIAATYLADRELIKILKKKILNKKFDQEEEKRWLWAWKNASLIQTYGKKGVVALAARGVGPTNAVRILRKYHKTEDDFYLDIIRAEREYIRTKAFWDK